MSVPVSIEINETKKTLIPDRDIEIIINCFLIDLFCKQQSSIDLVRSEKLILLFLLKEIPFKCIAIPKNKLDAFKEAVKLFNLPYHALDFELTPDLQFLFYREIDSVNLNEVLKNNSIEVVEDLGCIKIEDDKLKQHTQAALHYLSDDELLDFQKLFINYMEDGGTIEECKAYMKAMASGPLFETLIQSNQIKGIKISGFKINTSDQDIRDFVPESEIKGGNGSTNYLEKAKLIKMQASNSIR